MSVCYSQWRNTCIRGSKLNWSKLGSVLLKLRSFSKNSSLPDYTPWIFLQSCYHLSTTKLLILLVVIILPLLLLYYCFVSAFYRFNCIETVKCIQKNLNFSYRYLIFYISGKKRKHDREFKGPIADRYICTLFLCLFYTRYWLDYLPLSLIFYHPSWPSLVNIQPIGFLVDLFFNFFSIEKERKEETFCTFWVSFI